MEQQLRTPCLRLDRVPKTHLVSASLQEQMFGVLCSSTRDGIDLMRSRQCTVASGLMRIPLKMQGIKGNVNSKKERYQQRKE
jgi:hypothetical protein